MTKTTLQIRSTPLLVILLATAVLLALRMGAYPINWQELLAFCSSGVGLHEQDYFLLFNIRLPRVLLAAGVGAGLAVSGAAIQGLFRNPLADQTLIGVSSGAMLFAVLAIATLSITYASLPSFLRQSIVAFGAFSGGVLTTWLVFLLSSRNGRTSVVTMLLAGIAISAFAAAITSTLIYTSDDQQLRDITFWSMGSMGGAKWGQVALVMPVIILGVIQLSRQAKSFNAISLGEREAEYLGFATEQLKSKTIFWTGLMVGVCIAVSGLIGFVGLIVPHFLRLIQGPDYTRLLRNSALSGAIFLVAADTLARIVIAPAELPIGIVTAVIGAPFFLYLLLRKQQEYLV